MTEPRTVSPAKRAGGWLASVSVALAVDARLDDVVGEPGALMLGALCMFVVMVLVRVAALWAEDVDEPGEGGQRVR